MIDKVFDKHAKTSLSFLDQQTTYLRNSEGLLQGILDNSKPSIRFEYDENDAALSKRVYRNQQTEKVKYNALGNIKKIKTAGKSIKYKSDKTGLIAKKGNTDYQYDNNGRLVKAGKETFDYDAVGNLTQNRYHPTTNQLLENRTHLFEYDARGNLRKKTHKQSHASLHFEFNSLDQLVRVSGEQYDQATQTSNHLSLEYQYDALNRRISKTHNGNTEYYLYDQLSIIAILDENRQTKATIIHDDEIDTPLSITNQNGTFYYHRDHQGSIIALTNENGDVVESIQYDDSYGKIVEHQKIVETNNPYCYTGRELDTNELYYYRARYYDPTSQQFLSEDPIGFLSGDFNFYRYVGNDPVNWIDSLGLQNMSVASCKKMLTPASKMGGKFVGRWAGRAGGVIVGTAASGFCDTATVGGCAVANPAMIAGAGAVGGVGGSKLGGWLGGLSTEVSCRLLLMAVMAAKAVSSKTGAKSKGKTKDVDCGDYGVYKNQKNPSKQGLERDHIPSTAAILKRTADMLGTDPKKLSKCVTRNLKNLANTLAMPKMLHKKGRTNSGHPDNGYNDPAKIEADSKDLGKAAENDATAYEEKLDDESIPEECKDILKDKLADIKKLTDKHFVKFIGKIIDLCGT